MGSIGDTKYAIFTLILLFLASFVSGLGVTPARTTMDFEAGASKTVNFEIINTEGKASELVIGLKGDLAQLIKLESNKVSFSEGEKSKKFSYAVNFPSTMNPGLNTAEIVVLEIPGGDFTGTSVSAALAVVTQLHVYVPYPGKYAEAKMNVVSSPDGATTFVFPVVSMGEHDLARVRAVVDITDRNSGEEITSFSTEEISIASGEKADIVYELPERLPDGQYSARAIIIYDEEQLEIVETFDVGSSGVIIKEIKANNFELGEIAKFEILVENKLSSEVKDAYVQTRIFDERQNVLSDFKSGLEGIGALSSQLFVSYWDSAGFKEGKYETEVSINYGGVSNKNNVVFDVSENELKVIGLGYVVSSSGGGEGGSSNLIFILVGIIILLVLLNLVWFMIIRKKLKGRTK